MRQGAVASCALASGSTETAFYEGKLAVTKFWCQNVLPGLGLRGGSPTERSTWMELRDEVF
ncbi:MAG: acyl-CoA dehydrogenase C-terminal domain-containing protein [Byssovorax sp.]